MKNELGKTVPKSVVEEAKERGCHQGVKYVYKDGEYGNKKPAASIGGKKATRFGNMNSAEKHKVSLGDGWVAFESPTGSKSSKFNNLDKSFKNNLNINTHKTETYTNFPINIKRETEFYQGYIRFKISVSNESQYVISDVSLDFIYDEALLHIVENEKISKKNGKFILDTIPGGKSKTLTILFEPLTCSKATDIKCIVLYQNYMGNMQSTWMEPKEIRVICPIMKTDQDINIGRLKEFIEKLPSRDNRIYEISDGFDINNITHLSHKVLQKHDIKHVSTLSSRDKRRSEIWYYGKTKVNNNDIIIKISIFSGNNRIELFAATNNADSLTGLLAEIGRELKQTLESISKNKIVNVYVKDSVVQHTNLLDMCDVNGNCDVNVVIEDSIVQRSNLVSANNSNYKEEVNENCNPNCPCWGKNITHPRRCPICNHIFKGNGWDGIDAHYKAKHEKDTGVPYHVWWSQICTDHKSR